MAKSIRDAMTEDPRSIGASASVVEAARLMREDHIGSLPITDDEKLDESGCRGRKSRADVGRGRLLSGPHQC